MRQCPLEKIERGSGSPHLRPVEFVKEIRKENQTFLQRTKLVRRARMSPRQGYYCMSQRNAREGRYVRGIDRQTVEFDMYNLGLNQQFSEEKN